MTLKYPLMAIYTVAIISCFFRCTCSDEPRSYEPIRSDEFIRDNSASVRYKANEILVLYKGTPSRAKRDDIRLKLHQAGIDTTAINVRVCNSCSAHVELWQANDIHTVIHGEEIRAGTVSGGSKGVGEDTTAIYSLNYIQQIPTEELPTIRQFKFGQQQEPVPSTGKDTIVIAVLDTGIDTLDAVESQYIWRNASEKSSSAPDADGNCYPKDIYGWNFVSNSPDVRDDNLSRHGSIISKYIVNEFAGSSTNFVQIMTLKTHDNSGSGDLFASICALHYAIDKGANIINASWGFYYYLPDPHPYLDSLITKVLADKGILFVTASGNKIDAVDAAAKAKYQDQYGVTIPDSLLRNLGIHNFFPACLSDSVNNVIVATTSTTDRVSPTQNYLSRYVDFGVTADSVDAASMKFLVPYTSPPIYISGSSFATAILTGKIGATVNKSVYGSSISKQTVFSELEAAPSVVRTSPALNDRKLVRKGRYVKRE
jgi:hypothetical protein